MQNNLDRISGLKWQYIALEQNYVINYPAADICWPNYVPRRRSVVPSSIPLLNLYTICAVAGLGFSLGARAYYLARIFAENCMNKK